MIVKRGNYNISQLVATVNITSGTKTEVGTAKDYEKIVKCVEKSGLMMIKGNIDGNDMAGSVLANHFYGGGYDGIDFGGVTNFGWTPSIIAGSLELGSGANAGKCYVTMTVTPVSASQAKTTTKSKA